MGAIGIAHEVEVAKQIVDDRDGLGHVCFAWALRNRQILKRCGEIEISLRGRVVSLAINTLPVAAEERRVGEGVALRERRVRVSQQIVHDAVGRRRHLQAHPRGRVHQPLNQLGALGSIGG